MRKANVKEMEQVTGGRWKCTVCGKKFWLITQAYGDHLFNCITAKIKWVLW